MDGLKNGMSCTACFILFLKVLSNCKITRNVSETYMRTTHWTRMSGLTMTFEHVTGIHRDHLLIGSNHCTKISIDQVKGSKDIERKSGLTLTYEHVTRNSIGIIYSLRATPVPSWYWSSEGVKRYWADNAMGWEEWFDVDLWTYHLKINRDHLLIEGIPCTKFGFDQVKGSKDIERTTLGLQTDWPTYQPTDRPTIAKQYAPFVKGGIIKAIGMYTRN